MAVVAQLGTEAWPMDGPAAGAVCAAAATRVAVIGAIMYVLRVRPSPAPSGFAVITAPGMYEMDCIIMNVKLELGEAGEHIPRQKRRPRACDSVWR